jgi:hypothetical protein
LWRRRLALGPISVINFPNRLRHAQKPPGLSQRVAQMVMGAGRGDDVEQVAMLARRTVGLMCNYT